ncbi:hypothetical protein PAXRUDRAFT_835869 [Paxillus rubicundulus Ve08.2h10]|uniref:DUF7598 domain-containing protein n=1 Tax=Paxillus rubicundulus Ve08.2h10 TaxID=930991 RepID=A0A0D0CUS3_9AGAM|nr:hypothetical protein PAXRUDRAFT_835869 [Paxillus rubicundulus Ve08.2h10]
MFLPGFARVFIALNVIRALSIIALLLVFASSIVVLVDDVEAVNTFVNGGTNTTSFESGNSDYIPDSTVPNQPAGAFWAVLNRIFIIFQTIVLILSEIGWPAAFFARFFPVLGRDFGLGALGVMQCLIGASVLSHYVNEFPLVTTFFLFSIGCVNILFGLIFREKAKDKRSILSWRERGKDVLPTHVRGMDVRPVTGAVSSVFSGSGKVGDLTQQPSDAPSRLGLGFGRQGEKAAMLKGFLITKPLESLPRHAT